MRHATIPLTLCALLALAGPSAAQPAVEAAPAEAQVPRPATLALEPPGGGAAREYQVDDLSISVSRTLDGRGETRGDVTLSLGSIRPLDTFVLEWARQGETGPEASRRAVITVPATQQAEGGPAIRYELEGAKVLGFSASHSGAAGVTQVMLQIAVRRVSLNGVVLN